MVKNIFISVDDAEHDNMVGIKGKAYTWLEVLRIGIEQLKR